MKLGIQFFTAMRAKEFKRPSDEMEILIMEYFNETTNQTCTLIKRTMALAPYSLVQYSDGTQKLEHCANLKRLS